MRTAKTAESSGLPAVQCRAVLPSTSTRVKSQSAEEDEENERREGMDRERDREGKMTVRRMERRRNYGRGMNGVQGILGTLG